MAGLYFCCRDQHLGDPVSTMLGDVDSGLFIGKKIKRPETRLYASPTVAALGLL